MKKRSTILILVTAMLALALVLPFSISADASGYVYGVIWDDVAEAASLGSQVEVWRDGRYVGVSEAKDKHGSWGVQVRGIKDGGSTITVKLVDRAGVTPLYVEYGGHNVGIKEVTFVVEPGDLTNGCFGPIRFGVLDDNIPPPLALPEPPASMYVYGRVWDTNTGEGIDGVQMWFGRMRCQVDDDGNLVPWLDDLSINTTAGGGYFGYGVSAIETEPYYIEILKLPPGYWNIDPHCGYYKFGPDAFAELVGPFDFELGP